MMNFPATGGISDDAQFFFEDYNFYSNAASVTNGQRRVIDTSIDRSIQQNLVSDLTPIASPPGTESGDLAFSTLIGNALSQDGSPYDPGHENGRVDPEPAQAHRQRTGSSSSRATTADERKRPSSKSSSNKICRVCGDKALGYNFNVVTCESCKAFFRRNALKKKKLQCPFQNRCTVTVSSRRYCQKCRLHKCFEVGMKAEYIMTEEQRAQKRQRLLERESQEAGISRPGSVKCDDVFLGHGNSEIRDRYDSVSSERGAKPVFTSSKSSTGSSECQHENQSSTHSPIDVAAWVNEISAQPPTTLTSPSDASPMTTAPGASESDDDTVTIRIPKSALLGILFNNNDRTQQMTALGQAVVASASISTKGTAVVGPGVAACTCPCACAYGRRGNQEQRKVDSAEAGYSADFDQMYGALTAESQMAYSGMDSGFSLFPIQEEQSLENGEPSHLSLATLSVTDDRMALYPVIGNEEYTPAPVRSSASMELDWDILTTITNAFEVDWQLPLPFPGLVGLHSKYAKLDELLMANEEWNQFPKAVCPLAGSTVEDISAQDFFNLIHHSLRYTIKQHKRLSSFSNLAAEDQQALIKAHMPEMVTLRAIMKFDAKTEQVQVQYPGREYMGIELTKRIRGGVYKEFKQLIMSFPEKWRRDEALMLILIAMALFNPDCPGIVNRQAVLAEREAYYQLLKDYLGSTYGEKEAKQAYNYLIESIQQLVPWVHTYSLRVVFELEPQTMEPLMVEVFDFH